MFNFVEDIKDALVISLGSKGLSEFLTAFGSDDLESEYSDAEDRS